MGYVTQGPGIVAHAGATPTALDRCPTRVAHVAPGSAISTSGLMLLTALIRVNVRAMFVRAGIVPSAEEGVALRMDALALRMLTAIAVIARTAIAARPEEAAAVALRTTARALRVTPVIAVTAWTAIAAV